ncbi:hypothetical protein G7Z17_g4713 [Cylindrodendrum hubeiense]|uniref:Major facilitator superfamily (MFS) profile domain-containing protein n=1 Tax=Cylindrodendrum hubeiense TaxID=595255 RepID=A0A9P5HDG7_9HYPO|nr:hypothetical protein G7Z17_g4713 [Cylindrodendrum hubeiense]
MARLAPLLRTIVRNDAMRADPEEIYGWRVFALVFSACFGGMLFGWETGAIGGVLAMDATQERYSYVDLSKDSGYIQGEIQEMAEQLQAERLAVGEATTLTLLKEMTLIPGNRKRLAISITLMICQQMTGVNAVNYYAPQIFKTLGMTGTETSLFATGIYGIVKVSGCAIFLVFAADSLGRRRSLLWTSLAQATVMFIIGIYGRTEPPVEGKPISAFGYVAIACIYLWAAEIPTARLRAMNVAIGAATQWLFNFIIARTVLTMQATMGQAGFGMFFMFGSFCILMGAFVWFFVPETKGLGLEQMDELFGVTVSEKRFDTETQGREPRSIQEGSERKL